MVNYNNEEYVDMIMVYGAAEGNAERARQIYFERFPNRQTPCQNTFLRLIQRARATGNVQPRHGHGGGRPQQMEVNVEEAILDMIDADPTTSTRQIAQQVEVSQSCVWNTLHRNGLYPYHFQRVQGLIPGDFPLRQQFCEWLLDSSNRDREFPTYVLVTDECCFTRDGVLNFHNYHTWTDENPHRIRQNKFQHRFSLNLWAGIVNNTIIGPFELPARLNGASYLHFLQETLPELLEDIPLAVRRNMWFMHDGCPAHFSRGVRDHLDTAFPQKWIGRGGFISWPPRSPDLNPLDFFLWGYMKGLVYATEVNTIGELRRRINNTAENLRQQFPRVSENWIRRAQLCVQVQGQHFEQLL